MTNKTPITPTANSSGFYFMTSPLGTPTTLITGVPTKGSQKQKKTNPENAVYAYVRALRALGQTSVIPSNIAIALGLSPEEVMHALKALQRKGIKVAA